MAFPVSAEFILGPATPDPGALSRHAGTRASNERHVLADAVVTIFWAPFVSKARGAMQCCGWIPGWKSPR